MSKFNHTYSKKDSPYKVPEGYFTAKQDELLAIASGKPQRRTSLIQLVWISTAVAAALLIAIYIFPAEQSAELTPEYVENYILNEYNYGYTEEALILELDDNEIVAEESWPLNNQAMEEFLDNNFDQTLHYEYY